MQKYFNPQVDWKELEALETGLTKDAARFDAKMARAKVLSEENYDDSRIMRYLLRAFDLKWCYYSSVPSLWNRARPALFVHQFPGNAFLVSRPYGVTTPEGVPFYCFADCLGDYDFIRGHSYHFPIRLNPHSTQEKRDNQPTLLDEENMSIQPKANLSKRLVVYLSNLGIKNPDEVETAELIWMHALAIGYSPVYLEENADGIKTDWPRIPLPDSKKRLIASAELGRQVASLLDTENGVVGVTTGNIRSELRAIAPVTRKGGGQLNPAAGDLALDGSWGYLQRDYITMPGYGTYTERNYTTDELVAIKSGAASLDLTLAQALEILGDTTHDIYLNDLAYWRNVPANVWAYTIGGYQVIKKWLSYREKKVLGRGLKLEEVMEVTNMARGIASIILLQPKLDANYQTAKSSTYDW